MPYRPPPVALVLGLTGAIGQAIAAALARRGWAIRTITRRASENRPALAFAVDWRPGDALDQASVLAAADGVELIVHGVNPPGYRRWREDGLPMLANTIAAAKAASAAIIFPANVYVFSSTSAGELDENAPRSPTTRKGQVRLEMEQMLERAALNHQVQVIILRAGDFFGPGVSNSWFAGAVAKGGSGREDHHTLAPRHRPRLGLCAGSCGSFRTLVDRRATLPAFTLAHFRGHSDMTGREIAEATQRAIGRASVPIKPFPWITIWLGAPFVPFLREALEMTWLWRKSLTLDNRHLRELIGDEPHTPLDDAVKAALGTAR